MLRPYCERRLHAATGGEQTATLHEALAGACGAPSAAPGWRSLAEGNVKRPEMGRPLKARRGRGEGRPPCARAPGKGLKVEGAAEAARRRERPQEAALGRQGTPRRSAKKLRSPGEPKEPQKERHLLRESGAKRKSALHEPHVTNLDRRNVNMMYAKVETRTRPG